ncbi:MAG TPA: RNA polymerase sigma factor [Vicinamibacterales bacterium]|nr:RNA polymerase sigma factor [Vicinamibacterales bacterium]
MQNAVDSDGFYDSNLAARTDVGLLPPPPPDCCPQSTDQQLVQGCLYGDQRAWALLIGRYKNLIYSFPRRYGAGPADAADVFQLVCAELFRSLPSLRNHDSLRSWIMTVSSHQAYHWKRRHVTRLQREGADPEAAVESYTTPPVSDALEQSERDLAVRQAIAQLPERCRELVKLLFYQDPPAPYQLVAGELRLATGSIGLIRSRCLKRLGRILEQQGMHA